MLCVPIFGLIGQKYGIILQYKDAGMYDSCRRRALAIRVLAHHVTSKLPSEAMTSQGSSLTLTIIIASPLQYPHYHEGDVHTE